MKLASVRYGGEDRLMAASTLGLLVDLNRARAAELAAAGAPNPLARAAADVPANIVRLLELGAQGFADARSALAHVEGLGGAAAQAAHLAVAEDAVEFLPAVPNPPKVICVARNYADHAKEAGRPISPIPILFARFAQSLVGHGQPLVRPKVNHTFDWEGEVAVVIGKRCRNVAKADAMDAVAGYTLFNDGTIRDFQFRVAQYTAGKNFDSSGPLGPYVVTADEVADPHALELETTIDGEVVQQGNTRDMIYDIPTIIEHIAEWITLEPGDVIPMGTPAGVGFSRQPPRFLEPGNVVRVTATGLGALENPVVDEA